MATTPRPYLPTPFPQLPGSEKLYLKRELDTLRSVTDSQSVAISELQKRTSMPSAVGGTVNARTLDTGYNLSLQDGAIVFGTFPATNTGAMTLNVDGTGAKAVRTITLAAAPANYIRPSRLTRFRYDGALDSWIADREDEIGLGGTNIFWERKATGILDMHCEFDTTLNVISTLTFPVPFINTLWSATTTTNTAGIFANINTRLTTSCAIASYSHTGASAAAKCFVIWKGFWY